MAKKIFYDDDARARVLGGAKVLYDAVKVTYGPNGGNVVIGRAYGSPSVTHDGVTVADSIEIPQDSPELLGFNEGAQWIKEAASNLNKIAGDGTTTVTILTYHLLKEANRLVSNGNKGQVLRRELERACAEALKIIDELAEQIKDDSNRVADVATISAGDPVIGKMIAEVISKIGKDGVVTVEPGQGRDVEPEIVEGYTWNRGWVSPFFVTDDDNMQALYDNPAFILTMQKLHLSKDIVPLVEKGMQANHRTFVIMADELDGDALSNLIVNKLKKVVNIVAVKPPSFGDRRLAYMEDIAHLVGAKVIREEEDINTVDLSYIGTARKVIVNKEDSTIVEGGGDSKAIAKRIETLKQQAKTADNDHDKIALQARAAALGGKVAVIRVGGATETEIDERKFRVDDAVAATRVALEDGIVAGGGVTLLDVANKLKPETVGHTLLINALQQPFLHIMENNGLNAEALLAKVKETGKTGFGVNVMSPDDGLVDLKEKGVIDPARVTKEALINAVSIAATAVTMGALVVEIPEKLDPKAVQAANQMGY